MTRGSGSSSMHFCFPQSCLHSIHMDWDGWDLVFPCCKATKNLNMCPWFICDIFKDGDDEREYYSVVHFICGGILASHQPQTLLITRSPHTALPVDLFYDQTLTLSLLGINWFARVINDNTTHGFTAHCA